eukprot:EG_transcript_15408
MPPVVALLRHFQNSADHSSASSRSSVTLLAQIALPCLIFGQGPSSFSARGGTDVRWFTPSVLVIPFLSFLLTPLKWLFSMFASQTLGASFGGVHCGGVQGRGLCRAIHGAPLCTRAFAYS